MFRCWSRTAGARWSSAVAIASFVIRPSPDASLLLESLAKNSRRYAGQHSATGWSVEGGPLSTWTVVYEQTATGWSAFVPALPGVAAAAATHDEAEQLIGEAIALHLQGLAEDDLPIPDPHSVDVGQVELRQPA